MERIQGIEERRNLRARAALVQRLINSVIDNPSVTFTAETMRAWLGVPLDGAHRILANLVSSGLMREVQSGVWVRSTLPGMAHG